MTKIITICNNKGGVGKTTTIGAMASILASYNKKVLIVDGDPQGNSSQLFNKYRNTNRTIIDLYMTKNITINQVEECIFETDYEGISIIPSNEDFTFTTEEINKDSTRIQQFILKRALNLIENKYDFILIDNSPFFTILTINALCAAQEVIIPVEADGYSYQGLKQLVSRINDIMELNQNLEISKVFINKANANTTLMQQLYEEYKIELGETFSGVFIRQDNNAKESATAFVPLLQYKKSCNAIKDYKKLIANMNILETNDQKELIKEVKPLYQKEIKEYEAKIKKSTGDLDNNFALKTTLFNLYIAKENLNDISK